MFCAREGGVLQKLHFRHAQRAKQQQLYQLVMRPRMRAAASNAPALGDRGHSRRGCPRHARYASRGLKVGARAASRKNYAARRSKYAAQHCAYSHHKTGNPYGREVSSACAWSACVVCGTVALCWVRGTAQARNLPTQDQRTGNTPCYIPLSYLGSIRLAQMSHSS